MIQESSLYKAVVKYKVNGTHRWLAMQALCLLPEEWGNIFLKHSKNLLKGSKLPDTKFHDFKNHVFHPPDWGGAPLETQKRVEKMANLVKEKKYSDIVLEAGIVSHYIADVLNPMHTGQTDKEKLMHKYFEWGNHKLLKNFQERIKIKATGNLETVADIPKLVKESGTFAHQFYVAMVDGYDMEKGKKKPERGISDEMIDQIQGLLERAIRSIAQVWWTAIDGATSSPPPKVNTTIPAITTRIAIPIHLYKKSSERRSQGKILKRMTREYNRTGKIENSLDTDEKYQIQALKEIQDKQRTTPKVQEEKRARLALKDEIVDAPEIGSKTAERLRNIGIKLVEDLLNSNPREIVSKLNTKWIKTKDIQRWQVESQLLIEIPGIYGHDAQIMFNCGYTSTSQVAAADPKKLFAAADAFAKSKKGQRILRGSSMPTQEEVQEWIDNAKSTGITEKTPKTPKKAPSDKETVSKTEEESPKGHLSIQDEIVKAPEIGRRTAKRLSDIGIKTIEALMKAKPSNVASQLNVSWINKKDVKRWQEESQLMMDIPVLFSHDVQILWNSGYTTKKRVASAKLDKLLDDALKFTKTKKGEWLASGSSKPTKEEVETWIQSARA